VTSESEAPTSTPAPTDKRAALIRVERLSKTFQIGLFKKKTVEAVKGVSFDVRRGEIFGFLGPNGAGKTTTIKMLIGLLRPSAGVARIGGYDIQRDPIAAKSLIGYVPDQPYLPEKLTAREFLEFIAGLYQLDRDTARRRGEELLKLFDLSERGDDLVGGFSHGMRQKTALAGALLHNPQAFFLDEPTVGLDPRSARLIKDILREVSERGTAVFMSTHILEIAERMCDRVAIIDRGLGDMVHRELVSTDEVADLLLDVRSLLAERPSVN
jgi:ABC-2 type transport system ATP-binding protein